MQLLLGELLIPLERQPREVDRVDAGRDVVSGAKKATRVQRHVLLVAEQRVVAGTVAGADAADTGDAGDAGDADAVAGTWAGDVGHMGVPAMAEAADHMDAPAMAEEVVVADTEAPAMAEAVEVAVEDMDAPVMAAVESAVVEHMDALEVGVAVVERMGMTVVVENGPVVAIERAVEHAAEHAAELVVEHEVEPAVAAQEQQRDVVAGIAAAAAAAAEVLLILACWVRALVVLVLVGMVLEHKCQRWLPASWRIHSHPW